MSLHRPYPYSLSYPSTLSPSFLSLLHLPLPSPYLPHLHTLLHFIFKIRPTEFEHHHPASSIIIDDDGHVPSDILAPDSPSQINGSDTPSTSTSGPSAAVEKVPDDQSPSPPPLEQLLTMFTGQLSVKQVMAVFCASGHDFNTSMDCLLEGPTLSSILNLLNDQFEQQPASKIQTYPDDAWQDMVIKYKSPKIDLTRPLRVVLRDQPALDTGGVRQQVYNAVYSDFLANRYCGIYDLCTHSECACTHHTLMHTLWVPMPHLYSFSMLLSFLWLWCNCVNY